MSFDRNDLITLAILTDIRAEQVLAEASKNFRDWGNAVADSDESRWHWQIHQDNVAYATQLRRLHAKIDAALSFEIALDDNS